MIVLTLNSGSSSLKFGLYRTAASEPEALLTGSVEGQTMKIDGRPHVLMSAAKPAAVIDAIRTLLADGHLPPPEAIGHRIVHGGPKLLNHVLIDDPVLHALQEASALSPLHAPAALAIIQLAHNAWPDISQVACFDTAFHADLPDIARILPIPRALRTDGVRRYGFHGLSCESILRQLGDDSGRRLIIAHLGSGASITAVRDGRSIDTSMGLTPSGGIMMGTRSGDIDPGILIYLLRQKAADPAGLEDLIDHRSGLLGVSGLSGDMRLLHDAAPANPDARLAIAMFCMSVAKQIAAMMVALDGVDTIVFTGGIGEHDAAVRGAICQRLAWTGLVIDDERNRAAQNGIGADSSRCSVRVLPSQEDEQIALHTCALTEH